MSNPVTAILIGAGNRGMSTYGQYALNYSDKLQFIAVAEPLKSRREIFAKKHDLKEDKCYESWEDLLKEDRLAEVAVVCTQDQFHVDPTILALEKGYHVLLEKPMAHTLEGCMKIIKKVEQTGNVLGVGHVLRYTKFFSTIHDTIRDGRLGKVMNISLRENLGWYHMAHSYVRGNWRNVNLSSPMILAKCCHDLDLLYWMIGSLPAKISSFGHLIHFKQENAPNGAPDYCVEGCPVQETCLYYAPRIYIDILPIIQIMESSGRKGFKILAKLRKNHANFLSGLSKIIPLLKRLRFWSEWPVEPLYSGRPEEESGDYSDETKKQILETSPYGRCVYKCDNDVVDHQVVNIDFENGCTANLTMQGFSHLEGRTIRIDGTKATIIGEFLDSYQSLRFYDHITGNEEFLFKQALSTESVDHGGGDKLLIDAFIENVRLKSKSQPLTNAIASLESHIMAFAANDARLKNSVIIMEDYRNRMKHV